MKIVQRFDIDTSCILTTLWLNEFENDGKLLR